MGEGLFQPLHLLLILGIALLFFGPQKLPQLGKGLGEAIRNFRDGLHAAPDKKTIDAADKKAIDEGADKK
jgi:sec-independent protein translocase protein TatA